MKGLFTGGPFVSDTGQSRLGACALCSTWLPDAANTCPGCGAIVRRRLLIEAPFDRVRPLIARVSVAHGIGPDAAESTPEGVVFAGSKAAVDAMASALRAGGFGYAPLPTTVEPRPASHRGLYIAIGLAAAALVGIVAWAQFGHLLPALDDAPQVLGADRRSTAVGSAATSAGDAGPMVAPGSAGPQRVTEIGGIKVVETGPSIDPERLRRAVRSTVHIVARNALGAGVIVSTDGFVLTNAHVVGLEEKVQVTLHDGTEYTGRVVSHRRSEDLAVIRIRPKGKALDPMPFGRATALQVGDPIFAVGSPRGHDFSVTRGYVAHTRRWLLGKPCIQIDAPIDQGNSGGPLVDASGALVGINTYKSLDAEGVGYAQMIERAVEGSDAILAGHLAERPMSDAFAAVMTEAQKGRAQKLTDDDAREALRDAINSASGRLFVFAVRQGGYTSAAQARGQRMIRQENQCAKRLERSGKRHLLGLCLGNVTVHVLALTRKGERPKIPHLTMKAVIGSRLSERGTSMRDSGWRSHRPTDPEGMAALNEIGDEIKTELSVWSTHVTYEGHRVAPIAVQSSFRPPHVVLVHGEHRTNTIRLRNPRFRKVRP